MDKGETKEYILLSQHHGFKASDEEDEKGKPIMVPHTYKKGDKIELTADQAVNLANKIKDPELSDVIAAEDLSKANAEIERLSTELTTANALIDRYKAKLDELGESLDDEPDLE